MHTDAAQEPRRARALTVLALIAVMAAELSLFCWGTSRHSAWIYPRWFDQVQYLSEAYDTFGVARAHGFVAAAAHALREPSPQGALHAFLALIVFEVAGPSRAAALSVNMLAFLALQGVTFGAVSRMSRSRVLPWGAMGLLAALWVPWSGNSGSATDFRLDWMSACAYGAALGVALAGNGFRSTRASALFGVSVGLVLLLRFLTAVYFGLIYAGLAVWLLTERGRARRLGNLILSAAIAAVLSGWAFWHSRHPIYGYYWMGHFGGPEAALRNQHMGPSAALMWFASQLLFQHVGVAVAALGLAGAAVILGSRSASPPGEHAKKGVPGSAWLIVTLFFAMPAAILTLHPAKASQPLVVLVVPVVWMIVLAWMQLGRRAPSRIMGLVAGSAAACGALIFVARQAAEAAPREDLSEFRAINAVADFVYFRSEEAGLTAPRIAVTGVSDALSAGVLGVLGFERHGHPMGYFQAVLPEDLEEIPRDTVEADLGASDFVLVITQAPALWPFDRQMARMRPENLAWCRDHLAHRGDMEYPDLAVSVFERSNMEAPDQGRGVDLPRMLAASRSDAPGSRAELPGRPYLCRTYPVLWSTRTPLAYGVRAAYSPLAFRAEDLPEGVRLSTTDGALTGRFARAGTYVARVGVSNAAGTTDASLTFIVGDEDWTAKLEGPVRCAAGGEIGLFYGAFDGEGHLDFIDITDLSDRKVLVRLTPRDFERTSWEGSFRIVLVTPGMHRLVARTVRYDPKRAQYSYLDRECDVDVRRDRGS